MIRVLLLVAALGPPSGDEPPPVQRPTSLPPPAGEEESEETTPEAEPPKEEAPEPAEAEQDDSVPRVPPPTGDAAPWRREGLMFAGSVGVTHCFQGGCEARGHLGGIELRPSPLFRFELGYRPIPYLGVMVSGLVAYHPMKVQEAGGFTDAEASGVSLNVGPALYAFPVRRGRIDPYVSVFVGYVQYRVRLEQTENAARWETMDVYDRAVIRLGVGLSVHMSPTTAFGIRLDQNLPFAGTHCRAVQPVPTSTFRDYAECTSIHDAEFKATQGLPFFWEFSIHAIETFDVVRSSKKRQRRRAHRRSRRTERQAQ